jgi:hypothetical protein
VGCCEGATVGMPVGLGEGPREGTVLGNAVADVNQHYIYDKMIKPLNQLPVVVYKYMIA